LLTAVGPHAIISGHIDLDSFPRVHILPDQDRIKRISYLATVRNHALDPLIDANTINSTLGKASIVDSKFDRLLFLNDVVFNPKDAADLLFATNAQDGKADYDAACAMDYINPIKFYDRFAMRDSDAYRVGLPFYPWFVRSGGVESWNAVMAGSDAVPVQSCWGGMVAFQAKYFQNERLEKGQKPLRFRSEPDAFWDASECCLIHADLQDLVQSGPEAQSAKIFVNPYVRVAYGSGTLAWLEFSRRFERLFTIPHVLLQWILKQPWEASRRLEIPGRSVRRNEWFYTGPIEDVPSNPGLADIPKFGSWQTMRRTATPGGYCGYDFLLALKTKWEPGEKMWEKIEAPPGEHGSSTFT
jgi:hypothetical protein